MGSMLELSPFQDHPEMPTLCDICSSKRRPATYGEKDMLVYCNSLTLRPPTGHQAILERVARWLGTKSRGFVDPNDLVQGAHLRLNDGSNVESSTSRLEPGVATYPHLSCVRLTHGDDRVQGRQWITEIGLEQLEEGGAIRCSVLLHTSEISTRVTAPIQVTRPRIVEILMNECSPIGTVPGQDHGSLTEANARMFLAALEHESRRSPWVIVSPTREGTYLLQPYRLQSMLYGLAEIKLIPPGENTYEIERQLGGRYSAWLGAVKIIFPARIKSPDTTFETSLLRAEAIDNLTSEGSSPETEVLATITHRTNLPNFWKHISPAVVAHARLRQQLEESINRARASSDSTVDAELLEMAYADIDEKDRQIKELQSDIIDRDDEIRRVQGEVEALKFALSRKTEVIEPPQNSIASMREALLNAVTGTATLEQSLRVVSELCPDRVVVLDSAYASARDSKMFEYKKQALEMIVKLATEYWTTLSDGGGDAKAKAVFGKSYAARESEILSKEGRQRRTFKFDSKSVEMLKHLKIGVADNKSKTLRIHFEWIAEKNIIVIGHCGGHLDF